jgi:hypothetical protein
MMTWCAGLMMPLQGAGLDDCDWYSSRNGNLYARFFVDPSVDTSSLGQPDSGGGTEGAGKQRTAADSSAGTRSVFNFSIMFGGSFAFFQMRRTVAPYLDYVIPALNIETKKMIGLVPGIKLNFFFNVARYFGLGFGADAGYFHLSSFSKKLSHPDTDVDTYLVRVMYKIHAPDPRYYLEVPAYGMMRIYFSENFKAIYLDLGGGADFFLLGHPNARSYFGRAGLGFALDNGFTMEFDYQYNSRLIEQSNLTNLLDMHRVMLWMGYCVNPG